MGLKGDLTAGEILEQVLHASRVSPIRNVVFMGETDTHDARKAPFGWLFCDFARGQTRGRSTEQPTRILAGASGDIGFSSVHISPQHPRAQ